MLSVLAFHAFPTLLPGGFVGVDVFFVISGYLIHGILLGNLALGRLGLGDFYVHRIKRILPALVLVLFFTFAVGWHWLLQSEYKNLGKDMAASAAFVVNFVLLHDTGYFDAAAETKPLLHLWSLAVEEQFYLVWPLLLALAWKARIKPIVVVGVVGLASFAACVWLTATNASAAFYLPATRLWELLIGAALSSVGSLAASQANRDRAAIGGLALIGLSLALLHRDDAFPGYWALLPTVGTALLLAAGPQARVSRLWLSSRPMTWIGKISYPLYLWHWPLLTIARSIHSEPLPWPVRLGLLALSVLLAWVTFLFVERPIRFGTPARWKTATPLTLLVVVGLLGHSIYRRDGLEFRLINRGLPAMKPQADRWYRLGQCMIDATDDRTGPSTFAKDCDGRSAPTGAPRRPLALLWGDSHAASLYPGLLGYSKRDHFGLAQYTAAGCAPLVGRNVQLKPKQVCEEVTDFVLHKVAELKPEVVFLAGYWSKYQTKNGVADGIYPDLQRTLEALKAAGAGRVVLVGHLPTFLDGQPGIGSRVFVKDQVDRTYKGFDLRSRDSDDKARTAAAAAQVDFLSPIELLCNGEGCLISISKTEFRPGAWDYGHLTEWGSQFLVDKAVVERPDVMKIPEALESDDDDH